MKSIFETGFKTVLLFIFTEIVMSILLIAFFHYFYLDSLQMMKG